MLWSNGPGKGLGFESNALRMLKRGLYVCKQHLPLKSGNLKCKCPFVHGFSMCTSASFCTCNGHGCLTKLRIPPTRTKFSASCPLLTLLCCSFRPLYLYSCGRESMIWERPSLVDFRLPSDRLLKLAEPKQCQAAYLLQR